MISYFFRENNGVPPPNCFSVTLPPIQNPVEQVPHNLKFVLPIFLGRGNRTPCFHILLQFTGGPYKYLILQVSLSL